MIIKNVLYSIIAVFKMHKAFHGKEYRTNVLLTEIIRNVHSIEKGMCIDEPRMEYGKAKIKAIFQLMGEYLVLHQDINADEINMGTSAIASYLNFHKSKGYSSDYLKQVEDELEAFVLKFGLSEPKSKFGGAIEIESRQIDQTIRDSFTKFLYNRHSTRDFEQTPVDNSLVFQAVEIANRCPSACNRQTTRVYILEKNKIVELKQWLSGIGGFADSLNKLLVITGQISAFNDGEIFQHIMNAGIFTGYLTMALEACGLGACVVQRPLLYSRRWAKFARENGIPSNEQITCVIAVGNKKGKFKTPVSYRFNSEKIAKVIK